MYHVQKKTRDADWECLGATDDLDEAANDAENLVDQEFWDDPHIQARVQDLDTNEVLFHYVNIEHEIVDIAQPPEWVAELRAALAKWDASDTGSGRLLAETLMAATVLTHREEILGVWGNE